MRKYICMIGIMISVMLTSCGTEPTFNGSRTSDGTNFFMEGKELHGQYERVRYGR